MKHIALLVAAVLLAGCPRTSPPTGAAGARAASTQSPAAAPGEAALLLASRTRGFARLRDRGELLAYPTPAVAPRSGGRAWHRAELSEAHALRAIFAGPLHLRTPAGEALAFAYARHVEHPSGDWTWVGRLRGGDPAQELILTFGAKAVFGSIPRVGQVPLQVTTRNGATWVVEGDAATAAADAAAAVRTRGPDYLVPPKADAVAKGEADEAAVVTASPEIDLVLGYTAGFAASLGGQSQALTRLNFLVEVTNQAYLNSQVDGRVRLVHALQVSYPDATDNEEALTQLTGHSGSSGAPVPAALQPLRQARETHGADLVALVRKFNRPENDGCGIAWMIGGGQSGIRTSDAPFGYAVVSDGSDRDVDGKTYFCRDETLAHELGHNLGSQHDRATATNDGKVAYGVFAYSFGHKTGVGAGNFYTIMAYGDSGQAKYRVFSNPDLTTCGGFACGVAGQADNARSLRATLPIVATFRLALVRPAGPRVRNDLDGDGRTDLLFHNPVLARFAAWRMDGATVVGNPPWQAVGAGYQATATGDFNGDGRVDLAWSNSAGNVYLWVAAGSGFASAYVKTLPAGWVVVGAGDVNGDGKADLLLHNAGRALFGWWVLDGTRILGEFNQVVGAGYRMAAAGDFDGNGRVDLAWSHASGDTFVWLATGTGFQSQRTVTRPPGWQVVGAGDVDGDGRDDMLLHSAPSALFGWWLMRGSAVLATRSQGVGPGYVVSSTGDFDGNGRVDIAWINPASVQYLWLGGGDAFASRRIAGAPAGWGVVR